MTGVQTCALPISLGEGKHLELLEDEFLTQHIDTSHNAFLQVASSYVRSRRHTLGQDWATQKIQTLLPTWTAQQQANFLLCLPQEKYIWEIVERLGSETSQGYWKNVGEIQEQCQVDKSFAPAMDDEKRNELANGWQRAVKASISWASNNY